MEGVIVVWVGLAIIIGFIADSRGRSGLGFFFLAVVISPLLAGLIVALMPNLLLEQERERERAREHERQINAIQAIATNVHPAPPRSTTTDELERLASLRDRGVLTNEEFLSEKRKILSAT